MHRSPDANEGGNSNESNNESLLLLKEEIKTLWKLGKQEDALKKLQELNSLNEKTLAVGEIVEEKNIPEYTKEKAEEYLKNKKDIRDSNEYYFENKKREELIAQFNLSKELNYDFISLTIISGANNQNTPGAINVETIIELAEKLPDDYMSTNEDLKRGGLEIFDYSCEGNANGEFRFSDASKIIQVFHLTKDEILPIIEKGLKKNIFSRWSGPWNAIENIAKMNSWGITKNDLSEDFIENVKKRIDFDIQHDNLDLAGKLTEAFLHN